MNQENYKTSFSVKNGREANDYYATEPKAIDALLSVETFDNNIWEPCCGEGHLSKRLFQLGYSVKSTDLIDRGYGTQRNFLEEYEEFNGDIITNPPFKIAEECIGKALTITKNKVAFFMRLDFLEGRKRKGMWEEFPPKIVAVFSGRIKCAKNGDFENFSGGQTTFAWYIWEKNYVGETILKWIN